VQGCLGATDFGWYQHLQLRPHLDEVNFWRPGTASFRALPPGGLFFFKLKSPHNAIAGFGQFARFERMPLWLAWEVFGEANGVSSEPELVGLGVRRGWGLPIGQVLRLNECPLLRRECVQLEHRVVCHRFVCRDRTSELADAVKAGVELALELFRERAGTDIAFEPCLVSLKDSQEIGHRVLVVGGEDHGAL
jgi:hypothetical protein